MRADDLLARALKLSVARRAELASEIIASLDRAHEPDADAEAAWAEEITRRAKRFRAGRSRGEDWEVVRARIEKSLRRK